MKQILIPIFLFSYFLTSAQCTFTIEPNAAVPGCMHSESEARFQSLVNTTFSGNVVKKTSGNSSWSGSAFSTTGLTANGTVQTVVTQTNKSRIFGLSNSLNSYSISMNNVDYAIVLNSWGGAEIRESGSYKYYIGNYHNGDIFKISVENGTVEYYKNNNLLYSSSKTSSDILYVHLLFQGIGSEIANVLISQTTGAYIKAYGDNIPTGNTSFKWYKNGSLLSQTGASILLNTYSNGDVISCKATPGSGTCSGSQLTSNRMILHQDELSGSDNFYISAHPEADGCFLATESVIWNANIPENISISGGNVTKSQGYNTSNGGVYSTNKVFNDGYLEFSTDEKNSRKMVGLSSSDNGNSESSINYAFYLEYGGLLIVYENGAWRGSFHFFNTSDKLKIAVENGVVKYYKNEDLLYVSSITPNLPLIADGTIQDPNATITNATITNLSQGKFSAHFGSALNPEIDWKINGQSTGVNDSDFTLSDMANNDVISCSYSIPGAGCGELMVQSNSISIHQKPFIASNQFFIDGVFKPDNSTIAREEVVWDPNSLANVSDVNNTLTKTQGYNQFNAGGSSLNRVKNGGYVEFPVNETNKTKALGLSKNDPNYNYTSTNYVFQLSSNGRFAIYESGTWRLSNEPYAIGDILKIAVENNVVKYYRNETLVYTSNTTPTLPLLVDISLSSEGSSVKDVIVGNPNGGKFEAHVSGLGISPALDWKVNGISTGVNNPSYYNNAIENEDKITCTIIPDFNGCSTSSGFTSNYIWYSGPQTYTQWNGSVSSQWDNSNNWSYGIPNSEISARIGAGTPHNPVLKTTESVKNIDLKSGASLKIKKEASLIVHGNFTIQGSFNPGNGKVSFNGSGDQQINTSDLKFNKLIVNMSNADHKILLSSPIYIQKEIVFIKGKIKTGSQEVVFMEGSDNRTANAESFIDGNVRKIGDSPFVFPIGSGKIFAPIEISAPEKSTDEFTAVYKNADPNEAGLKTAERDSDLKSVSSCEYWLLDRTHGYSKVMVSLSYENERSCGIEDPSFLAVLHWNGSKWENMGLKSFDGNANRGTITSRNPIGDFSPFTIGSLSGINPLPIELSSFTVDKGSNKALLEWNTETELNNAYFTIERSEDAIHFHEIGTMDGAGTTRDKQKYHFTDTSPANGVNYYRLSQTDFDGKQTYFQVKSVYFESESGVLIYPNPSNGTFTIQRKSDNYAQLKLIDAFGKVQWQQTTGEKLIKIEYPGLAKGMYFLNVDDGRSSFSEKVVIQ